MQLCETHKTLHPLEPAPKATYDARIAMLLGAWGYVCETCFVQLQCQLGTGKGTKL